MDKPWKVIFAFVGVFVAGAIFGGLLSLRIGRQISEQRPAVAATVPPAGVPAVRPQPGGKANLPGPQSLQSARLMRQVVSQINLTPAQRERVVPAIERAVQDFWHHQQNYNRENAFITQRLKQDIGKELTPEQQTRLDELWVKQLDIFRKRQAEAREQIRGQLAPGQSPMAAPEQKSAPAEATKAPAPAAKPSGGI